MAGSQMVSALVDKVVKPFAFSELLAPARTLPRRGVMPGGRQSDLRARWVTALSESRGSYRLDAPLPEARAPPRVQSLAVTFNAVPARLWNSFRRWSEFSADTHHRHP